MVEFDLMLKRREIQENVLPKITGLIQKAITVYHLYEQFEPIIIIIREQELGSVNCEIVDGNDYRNDLVISEKKQVCPGM